MNYRFVAWAGVLISSLIAVGVCIRVLALHQIPLSETLVVRGLSCLILVMAYSYRRKLSLVPKSIRTQVVRASLAGLALTLLSLSYNWLSASSVALLSNVDVPLLVVLGPIIGVQASLRARGLSLLSIAVLVWYVVNIERTNQFLYGLGSLLLGSALLCIGYFFIKKSMNEENRAIAILTPSLALVLYGVLEGAGGVDPLKWSTLDLAICILSGVAMFFAYVATMKLYDLTDIASAEFPTLLSAIAIQPIESIVLREPLNSVGLTASILFVLVTYLIMVPGPVPSHAAK